MDSDQPPFCLKVVALATVSCVLFKVSSATLEVQRCFVRVCACVRAC